MKLSQLKDVLAVANKRSFRAAARHLHMTQPAISRSISELERDLGAVLFDRHARGAQLSPMGERFVQRASAAMAELQRARDEIKQLQGKNIGSVMACLSSGAQVRLLEGALVPFLKRYPGVQLKLFEGQYPAAELGLKDGSIDFYIGPEPDPETSIDSELVSEFMYDHHLVVVVRKGHPLSNAESLEELTNAQWVSGTPGHQIDNLSKAFLKQSMPLPDVVVRCSTINTILFSVMHTDLLALVPKPMVDLGGPPGVTVLKIKKPIAGPRGVFVRRFGMPLTPAAEYFLDMLRRANSDP